MKNRLLRFGAIILSVVCLIAVLLVCGFGRNPISVHQVKKIELTASDPTGTATVELKPKDLRKFIICYNLSRYAGRLRRSIVSVHFLCQFI